MDVSVAETLTSNDYHIVPVTEKQITFARQIAAKAGITLPDHALQDRTRLSTWIDEHKRRAQSSKFDHYPSSKQVRYAEVISRRKRRPIPHACFKDKTLMSKWIDANH